MNMTDFLSVWFCKPQGTLVSLDFGGYQQKHKCMRIKFIQQQLDKNFQEDAEMRSNHWLLFKLAAVIIGLPSEMGMEGSLQVVFDVIGALVILLLLHFSSTQLYI